MMDFGEDGDGINSLRTEARLTALPYLVDAAHAL